MRTRFACLLIAGLAITMACSESTQPGSPVGPSAVITPTSPTGPTSGALLTGTVTVASSTRTVRPAGVGDLTVSVSGTSLSAPVDGSGNFTLNGVPPGDVQIRISGAGVDAMVTVSGVQAGQTIRLKITVSGTTGTIDSDSRDGSTTDPDKRELEGRIETITAATSSLIVSGQLVTVSSSTVIRKGDTTVAFSNLLVGMRVHVKGTMSSSTPSSLLASEIIVQNENTNVPLKVEGVVAAAPTGTCPSVTFVLQGKNITVKADGKTNFKPGCSAVAAGATVEVMGRLESGASDGSPTPGSVIIADKVEVKAAADDGDDGATETEALEFSGTMSDLSGRCPDVSFSAAGRAVVANSSTGFKPSCSALKNGDSVDVKGALREDGKVLASKVERK